jgi:hypothetical protein
LIACESEYECGVKNESSTWTGECKR